MTGLERAVGQVLVRSERGPTDELNMKVVLGEPVLEALGRDTKDLDYATREHQVYDGTYLDYALLSGPAPALFVEAKSWGGNDPKWAAQTVALVLHPVSEAYPRVAQILRGLAPRAGDARGGLTPIVGRPAPMGGDDPQSCPDKAHDSRP